MHMAMPADGASLLASRVSRAEAIARELEREIAGGTYAQGDRLGTKGDLRARFGVAVATVNEAVRLLELRGLITARPGPGGGVFVAAPSARTSRGQLALGFDWGPDSLDDAVDVLDALEPLVLGDAAGRRTKADVAAMTKLLAQMEAAADDRVAYLALRMSLRRRVAKAGHNAPLQREPAPAAGAAYLARRMPLRGRVARAGHNAPPQSLSLPLVGSLEES